MPYTDVYLCNHGCQFTQDLAVSYRLEMKQAQTNLSLKRPLLGAKWSHRGCSALGPWVGRIRVGVLYDQ